jgi:hypothetical protein
VGWKPSAEFSNNQTRRKSLMDFIFLSTPIIVHIFFAFNHRTMTPKRIVIYASLCFSNIGGAHSFTVTPKFESALGSVIAKQQQIQKVTTSTLFYNDRNKESQEGESSLWLPSSGLSQDDQLLKMKNDMNRFASAKGALEELRSDIKQMKENLALSLVTDDLMRIVALKKSINEALEKDPEFVYSRYEDDHRIISM